jgi:hypothetical protein
VGVNKSPFKTTGLELHRTSEGVFRVNLGFMVRVRVRVRVNWD